MHLLLGFPLQYLVSVPTTWDQILRKIISPKTQMSHSILMLTKLKKKSEAQPLSSTQLHTFQIQTNQARKLSLKAMDQILI